MHPAIQSGKTRNLTTYIAGNPGKGKTSLLQRMVLHDVKAGHGVCVIDPTGDLVNTIIHWIPKSRIDDTILFDTDYPIPVDFFSYRYPGERQVLIDQLVELFKLDNAPLARPRLADILTALMDANAAIENPNDHYTLLHISRFITDAEFRKKIFRLAPAREEDWKDGMPPLKDMISIVDRLRPYKSTQALNTMFATPNGLKISEVMRDNKILLINLKDTNTDSFIGSLFAAKFQQATFARRYQRESERVPYYLYVDECNTLLAYAAKEFETILLRARKYQLCLIMANQLPDKLPKEIQESLGTIGTKILFNLNTKNSQFFKDELRPYTPADLLDLPRFKAICKTPDHPAFVLNTLKPLPVSPVSYAETIRNRYAHAGTCDSPQECSNRADGDTTPTDEDDQIPASPEKPIVPPHQR